jgi:uncharacterized protein YgiM (DUF1202 family)
LPQRCQDNVNFLSQDIVPEVGLGAQIMPPNLSFFGDPKPMRHLSAGLVASLATAAILAIAAPQTAFALSVSVPQIAPATGAITVADTQAVVSHAYAHLREKPSTSSKILAKLNKGTKVEVIEKVEGGKWAHVKVNNLEGYVATNLLK